MATGVTITQANTGVRISEELTAATVQDLLTCIRLDNPGIGEAPIDDNTYGRKNGGWVNLGTGDIGTRLDAVEQKNTEQDERLDGIDTANQERDRLLTTYGADISRNRQSILDLEGEQRLHNIRIGSLENSRTEHNQRITDNYNGINALNNRVITIEGDYLRDAPSTGQSYARKDKAWELFGALTIQEKEDVLLLTRYVGYPLAQTVTGVSAGQMVIIVGLDASNGQPIVAPMEGTDNDWRRFWGIAVNDIAPGATGTICTRGPVEFDTTGQNIGDALYLPSTGATLVTDEQQTGIRVAGVIERNTIFLTINQTQIPDNYVREPFLQANYVGVANEQTITGLKTFSDSIQSEPGYFARSAPGTMFFRPSGTNNAAGQLLLSQTGVLTTSGNINTPAVELTNEPDENNHATTKQYVDVRDAQNVKLTGDQLNIDGRKGFVNDILHSGNFIANAATWEIRSPTNAAIIRLDTSANPYAVIQRPRAMGAQEEEAESLTRRDYVLGLDAQNVKLSGSQTISDDKRFLGLRAASLRHTNDYAGNSYIIQTLAYNATHGDGVAVRPTGTSAANATAGIELRTFKTDIYRPRSSVDQEDTPAALTRRDFVDGLNTATNTRITTLDGEAVKITGDQEIAGEKTFTSPVVVPNPQENEHAATKLYVDQTSSGALRYGGLWSMAGGQYPPEPQVATFWIISEAGTTPDNVQWQVGDTLIYNINAAPDSRWERVPGQVGGVQSVNAAIGVVTLDAQANTPESLALNAVPLNGNRAMTGDLRLSNGNRSITHTATVAAGAGVRFEAHSTTGYHLMLGASSASGNVYIRPNGVTTTTSQSTFAANGTFSSAGPVLIGLDTDSQATQVNAAARKDYVDTLDAQNVKIGDVPQRIDGQKTFIGYLDLANNRPLRVDFSNDDGSYRDTGEVFKATPGVNGILEVGTSKANMRIFAQSTIFTTRPVEVTGTVSATVAATADNHLVRKGELDNGFVTLDTAQNITGAKTFATGTIIGDNEIITDGSGNRVLHSGTDVVLGSQAKATHVNGAGIRFVAGTHGNIGIGGDGRIYQNADQGTAGTHLTRRDYVDGNFVRATDSVDQNITGTKTFYNAPRFPVGQYIRDREGNDRIYFYSNAYSTLSARGATYIRGGHGGGEEAINFGTSGNAQIASLPNVAGGTPTKPSHLIRKDYVDGNFVGLGGDQVIGGNKVFVNDIILGNTAADRSIYHNAKPQAKLRFNSAGAAVLSAQANTVYLRPAGETSQQNQLTVSSAGMQMFGNAQIDNDLTTNGDFYANGGLRKFSVIQLPQFQMGPPQNDEYLVLCRADAINTSDRKAATALFGEITLQRGATSAGNTFCTFRVDCQNAYNTNTAKVAFTAGSTAVWTSVDIITIDRMPYYALRARTSGGAQTRLLQFKGAYINDVQDANMLTRVRESAANVVVQARSVVPIYSVRPEGVVTIGGAQTITGQKTFNLTACRVNDLQVVSSTLSVLRGGTAARINTGGVLASNSYSHASRVPSNGIYSLGQIHAAAGVRVDNNQYIGRESSSVPRIKFSGDDLLLGASTNSTRGHVYLRPRGVDATALQSYFHGANGNFYPGNSIYLGNSTREIGNGWQSGSARGARVRFEGASTTQHLMLCSGSHTTTGHVFIRPRGAASASNQSYFNADGRLLLTPARYTGTTLSTVRSGTLQFPSATMTSSGGWKYQSIWHAISRLNTGYQMHQSMGYKRTAAWTGGAFWAIGANDGYPTQEVMLHASTGALDAPRLQTRTGIVQSSTHLYLQASATTSTHVYIRPRGSQSLQSTFASDGRFIPAANIMLNGNRAIFARTSGGAWGANHSTGYWHRCSGSDTSAYNVINFQNNAGATVGKIQRLGNGSNIRFVTGGATNSPWIHFANGLVTGSAGQNNSTTGAALCRIDYMKSYVAANSASPSPETWAYSYTAGPEIRIYRAPATFYSRSSWNSSKVVFAPHNGTIRVSFSCRHDNNPIWNGRVRVNNGAWIQWNARGSDETRVGRNITVTAGDRIEFQGMSNHGRVSAEGHWLMRVSNPIWQTPFPVRTIDGVPDEETEIVYGEDTVWED